MSKSKSLSVLLSAQAIFVMLVFGAIPLIWDVGRRYEGHLFPVIVPYIDDAGNELPIIVRQVPSGPDEEAYVDVWVRFDKVRACDFLFDIESTGSQRRQSSLSWYSSVGERLPMDFEPQLDTHATRPVGEATAGPWRIYGIRTTTDTGAIVKHSCHPLWYTTTRFYPRVARNND